MWSQRCPKGVSKAPKNQQKLQQMRSKKASWKRLQKSREKGVPGGYKSCYCIGVVIKIQISPVPENIPKMLLKKLPERSLNRYKCVSGRLQKTLRNWMPQTMQHLRKCLPKWIHKSLQNRWKNGSRHTCHHWASLWHPREGYGGTPCTKMHKKLKKTLMQNPHRKKTNDAVRKRFC